MTVCPTLIYLALRVPAHERKNAAVVAHPPGMVAATRAVPFPEMSFPENPTMATRSMCSFQKGLIVVVRLDFGLHFLCLCRSWWAFGGPPPAGVHSASTAQVSATSISPSDASKGRIRPLERSLLWFPRLLVVPLLLICRVRRLVLSCLG